MQHVASWVPFGRLLPFVLNLTEEKFQNLEPGSKFLEPVWNLWKRAGKKEEGDPLQNESWR